MNKIIILENVNSTNLYAHHFLKSNTNKKKSELDGTVVWAKSQSEGRGQMGNTWESEANKNLTFSLITFPAVIKPESQFMISKSVSLGIIDSLKKYAGNLTIKWPNDIYHNNKKLGGILIENSIKGNYINSSIIGIGLNINQNSYSDSLPNPTSLSRITQKEYDLNIILYNILEKIYNRLADLYAENYSIINLDYINLLFGYGKINTFKANKKIFKGIIKGVNKYGFLKVKHIDSMTTNEYAFKEIEFLFQK